MSKEYITCRRCKVTAEVILKKDKPYQMRCPRCGTVENYKVAIEEAARDNVEDLLLSNLNIVKKRRKSTSKFRVGKN